MSDSLITLNPKFNLRSDSLSLFYSVQHEAMKFNINCPVLNPNPFYAKFKSSIFVRIKIALASDTAILSPILLFYRFSYLNWITCPD